MALFRETARRLAEARPDEAARARAWMACAVRGALAPRKDLVAAVRLELSGALPGLDALDDALLAAAARLDNGPYREAMTVHAAHARHPGVRAVFASRGLPGCPECAVGADESLAEAAAGEGFGLAELLDELRRLES